jgi:hypothetical protein
VLGKIASSSLKDAVITVDEWGLLSNRAGHELLRIAKEQGVLVRFVGDTRQHVAVEAGDFGSKTGHLLCKSDRWLASVHKYLRFCDLCKELAFGTPRANW